ncbi:hypothetical protein JCGZ_24194 [Jatropha curcas]|uniref:Uncharacterized protein n=1 Tax=Jatropha curcas TaxID=180498 RepID=A0A067K1P1_JATCU|nr:hypothetical protein JCGZ_24194 [Jatropha curcas]
MESLLNFESNGMIVAIFWAFATSRPPCTAAGGGGPVTGRRHSGKVPRGRIISSSRGSWKLWSDSQTVRPNTV